MRKLVVGAMALVLVAGLPATASAQAVDETPWNLDVIDTETAWTQVTGDGVTVAVVDSGVDKDHPEFAGRLDTANAASWIDCGPGVPPPCSDPDTWDDVNGHGTHVAGVVAAALDGVGVAGVARDATILPVRVLDEEGSGSFEDVAAGIRYAADAGAEVVNLSLGGLPVVTQLVGVTGLDEGFLDAIAYAEAQGALVVVAAGNDTFPLCGTETLVLPSGLCVGATDRFDVPAWYSNWGGGIDVVAPGGSALLFCDFDVLSTWPLDQETFCGDSGYEAIAGTSMAAPHVSGVGALLAEQGITGDAAADRIVATADDFGLPPLVPFLGPGRVNAATAVGA